MTSVKLPLEYTSISIKSEKGPLEKIKQTIHELDPEEVLIKVAYSSINPMDDKLREFNFFHLPYPLTLGFDFSGTVLLVGDKNHDLKIGDEVFGFSPLGGCFAEYVKTKTKAVVKKGSIPFKEASTYGVAYNTVYEAFYIFGNISKRKGQTVYIPGGGGGLGHFAIQLAKLHGLTVFTSGSKPESQAVVKTAGVEHYIDYSKQDLVKEILKATNEIWLDLVWDSTYSPASYKQSASVVAKGGRWVKLGKSPQPDASEAITIAKSRGAEVGETDYGSYWQPSMADKQHLFGEGLKKAVEYYEAGTVKPQVTGTVPLADIKKLQESLTAVATGKAGAGKIVVEVHKP